MTIQIWRLDRYGLWIETVAGTEVPADAWIPLDNANIKPVSEYVKDSTWIGVIETSSEAYLSRLSSEIDAEWFVKAKSFGWLLLLALWTASAPVLIETNVYKHTFTRKNDNSHPTASFVKKWPTTEEAVPYAMIDELNLMAEAWNLAKFKLKMKGKQQVATTWNTVSFLSWDELFQVYKMEVKMANNTTWFGRATAIPLTNLNLNIKKNLEQIYSVGKIDFGSQNNKNLEITWDMELIYNDDTFKTIFTWSQKKAIQIKLTWSTLVWATKYNEIIITLNYVNLEEWASNGWNDDILKQTFGFTSLYKIADSKSIEITLQNNISVQYN